MSLRFRKSIRLGNGLRVNLSKSGTSLSVGKRGSTVNFGPRGERMTVGVPGTGLSYSKRIGGRVRRKHGVMGGFVLALLIFAFLHWL